MYSGNYSEHIRNYGVLQNSFGLRASSFVPVEVFSVYLNKYAITRGPCAFKIKKDFSKIAKFHGLQTCLFLQKKAERIKKDFSKIAKFHGLQTCSFLQKNAERLNF
ncbi:hypothetical protein T01_14761 [Trichinella spiralis]|uniref:Uncharacterized protein n=1 Tax=Trichinella spiralis TaxID=6334 RepID=A0A0V1BCK9_TRISP|nr:hypothetical protein T01_14761 [Trichinella spiralis]